MGFTCPISSIMAISRDNIHLHHNGGKVGNFTLCYLMRETCWLGVNKPNFPQAMSIENHDRYFSPE